MFVDPLQIDTDELIIDALLKSKSRPRVMGAKDIGMSVEKMCLTEATPNIDIKEPDNGKASI